MRVLISRIFALLLVTSEIRSSLSRNELSLHLCASNRSLSVQLLTSPGDETRCQCQAGPTSEPDTREDYVHTPGIGSHKLHTLAKPWNEARRICKEENAHLAVINSKAEEKALLDELRRKSRLIKGAVNKDQAYLGIHDYFKEGEWLTIFGESLYSTGYSEWASDWYAPQPDNFEVQNCGALVVKGGMDDVKCHESFAFFCEAPLLSCSG